MVALSSVVRICSNGDSNTAHTELCLLLRNSILSFFRDNDDRSQVQRQRKEESTAAVVGADTTATIDNEPNIGASDNDDNCHITIRNKYFSADVTLKDLALVEEGEGGLQQHNQHPQDPGIILKEDGLILVFDALQSNPDKQHEHDDPGCSFDSLQSIHQKAVDNNTCGDLLRLCIGVTVVDVSSSTPSDIRGKDHEQEYSRRVLWCLDRGYEYIEADISEGGQRKGHDDIDKDGFARVVEAFTTTMWSSAIMSKSKTTELSNSLRKDKLTIQQQQQHPQKQQNINRSINKNINDNDPKLNEEILTNKNKMEEFTENQYIPPDPSLLSLTVVSTFDKQQQQQQQQQHHQNNSIEKSCTTTEALFGLKENATVDDNEDEDGNSNTSQQDMEAEQLFGRMEYMLKEASQIRQASKSGHLSDDERRERAGDAALALVNLMDHFGLDDDASDDDGDSSEDDGSS